jgi:hypothetical protein
LQALLRDSLGEAAEAKYTIRGPWADPKVEPVEKPPVRPSPENNGEPGLQVEQQADTEKENNPGQAEGKYHLEGTLND